MTIEIKTIEEFELELEVAQALDLNHQIRAHELKEFFENTTPILGHHTDIETKLQYPNKPVDKRGKNINQ